MNILQKLQYIKKITKLSQEDLAKELGVTFATLNSWINNRSTPHKKKQIIIDDLYQKYSGQKSISKQELDFKKEILKNKKFKNIIQDITTKKDIYDQLILELTYNSNSIEGSTLTENETADILFQNINLANKSLIEHLEVKNHQSALQYLLKTIKPKFIITEEFILKLHSILMNSIRDDAGLYRRHGVRIVGANVPTANYLKVRSLMKNLIKEINTKNNDLINNIATVHSNFEKIHPFSDGNGRIGRLLMTAMLLRKNIFPAIIKQENKRLYYTYLQKAQTSNDYSLLEDFIYDCVLDGYKIIE